MTTIQIILLTILGIIWLCISLVILINAIQSIVYDHNREKREKERNARDKEYCELRMKECGK